MGDQTGCNDNLPADQAFTAPLSPSGMAESGSDLAVSGDWVSDLAGGVSVTRAGDIVSSTPAPEPGSRRLIASGLGMVWFVVRPWRRDSGMAGRAGE